MRHSDVRPSAVAHVEVKAAMDRVSQIFCNECEVHENVLMALRVALRPSFVIRHFASV